MKIKNSHHDNNIINIILNKNEKINSQNQQGQSILGKKEDDNVKSEEKKEIIEFFTKSLKIVKKIVNSIGLTPAVSVAAKQAYQIFSSPSTGI
jgi:hypothetical protein